MQCLYSRLAGVHSGFSWYIVSKTESATRAVIKGPETIHFVPIPKNLRVPIIFGLLFDGLWSIFVLSFQEFWNLDVINVAGTGYCMTSFVLATKFLKIKIIWRNGYNHRHRISQKFRRRLDKACNFYVDEIIAISTSIGANVVSV